MESARIVVTRYGGPEVLQLVRVAPEEPGPGQVRVRVRAAGVAYADVLARCGMYPGLPAPPFTPGWDLFGTVEALGPDVTTLALAQPVLAVVRLGGYAQTRVLNADAVLPAPEGLDPAEAVCAGLNFCTARQMLRKAALRPGARILVHSAAGGVGSALLQLAALEGLECYGTASEAKQDAVARLGATPIDYRREDFVERIHALTEDGVDAVFDPLLGAHLGRSFSVLRRGGRLLAYGLLGDARPGGSMGRTVGPSLLRLALWNALPNGRRAHFFNIAGTKPPHPAWFHQDVSELLGLMRAGRLKPLIAARISLAEAARAHQLLESGAAVGKLVLTCDA